MNKKEFNEIYEESVYQARLMVATQLFIVKDCSPKESIKRADEFILTLMDEDDESLKAKFT